jgi:hypothetical protein
MNPDFEKDCLPIYCERCKQQGFIFRDDLDAPAFVVCSRCGWEASQLWCPKCGMGGDFLNVLLQRRPKSWRCEACRTEYPLPESFYTEPIRLYLQDELPAQTLERVLPPKNPASKWVARLFGILGYGELILLVTFRIYDKPVLAKISIFVSVALAIIIGVWANKLYKKENNNYVIPRHRLPVPDLLFLLLTVTWLGISAFVHNSSIPGIATLVWVILFCAYLIYRVIRQKRNISKG